MTSPSSRVPAPCRLPDGRRAHAGRLAVLRYRRRFSLAGVTGGSVGFFGGHGHAVEQTDALAPRCGGFKEQRHIGTGPWASLAGVSRALACEAAPGLLASAMSSGT
jgi:hypothetical protein